jgi:vacuolar protein-sorting-associated protein 4
MRMFEIAVGDTNCELSQKDYKSLAELSDGYSGSDISIAVQDALMQPVRKIQMATHYKKVTMLCTTRSEIKETNAHRRSWSETKKSSRPAHQATKAQPR